ncbi:MAG: MnhB domain-containing protein [Chloroflexota bacterium]|nr:MnhB domain-containing protein [Chloroflexota bacterium]
MTDRYPSAIVDLVSRAVTPAIQLFALYVVFHGHYSPGGGFQGGVLLTASIILLRLTQGREESFRSFPTSLAMALAALGVLLFILTGLASMFLGGAFLDYAYLPSLGASEPVLRYFGILTVEVGVALAVWGTLVIIYDQLGTREEDV